MSRHDYNVCPNCEEYNSLNAMYCTSCGFDFLTSLPDKCQVCGKYAPLNNKRVCDDCAKLKSHYVTKDSGDRQEFETGARRDTQQGKPRYDLIPPLALRRLAELYARGAEKYDDNNWQKGIPLSRYYSSLFRHLMQWREGDTEEDHLSAVIWNAIGIMWTTDAVERGQLPQELIDVDYPTNEEKVDITGSDDTNRIEIQFNHLLDK